MLICLGVCYFDVSLFYKSGSKLLTNHHIVRLSKCAFQGYQFSHDYIYFGRNTSGTFSADQNCCHFSPYVIIASPCPRTWNKQF